MYNNSTRCNAGNQSKTLTAKCVHKNAYAEEEIFISSEVYKNCLDLGEKLKVAYSEEKLNKVTGRIIKHYKRKQLEVLEEIFSGFSDVKDNANCSVNSKIFSKLIIAYHPDKSLSYKNKIVKFQNEGNLGELQNLKHIFSTIKILNRSRKIDELYEENEAVYGNDYDFTRDFYTSWEDYYYYKPEDVDSEFGDFYQNSKNSFYFIYMKNLEGEEFNVNLSYTEMEDLEGIETILHVEILDLSGNNICDISKLWDLTRVEELYLNKNQICEIDSLCNMKNLRILDLSYNQIDDIADLSFNPGLEFINLIGNPIPEEQIEELRKDIQIVLF